MIIQPINIFAKLKEVKYIPKLTSDLVSFDMADLLNENLSAKSAFILNFDQEEYALSQWVSPKRTRTFPLPRVYDTLFKKNRVTLIPFCKDEGKDGDRDFIQWDTIGWMSLLNVYVIVGYYKSATKNMRPAQESKQKISKHVLDYNYIGEQLEQLSDYHSSALHWNLKQGDQLPHVVNMTLKCHRKIQEQTGVVLHGEDGINKRLVMVENGIAEFKNTSRHLAQQAQAREIQTEQPKERTIGAKATITLENLIGGMYYLTADECFILNGHVFLIEKKHSRDSLMPSSSEIKDAFMKMALFSNIDTLHYENQNMPFYSAVGLTSETVQGILHSKMSDGEIESFFISNNIREKSKIFMRTAITEAQCNGFGLFLCNEKDAASKQHDILHSLTTLPQQNSL